MSKYRRFFNQCFIMILAVVLLASYFPSGALAEAADGLDEDSRHRVAFIGEDGILLEERFVDSGEDVTELSLEIAKKLGGGIAWLSDGSPLYRIEGDVIFTAERTSGVIGRLFYEFIQTGLFAIGGGLATLPFLADISDRTGWYSQRELINMIAVSESTPGPIGINMATYVGYVTAGAPGAVVATFALILPALIIALIIARFLKAFSENRFVKAAFYGLRPVSVGLIAAAGFTVLKVALLDEGRLSAGFEGPVMNVNVPVLWPNVLLAIGIYLILRKWKKLHPAAILALSAIVGIVFRFGGV